MDVVRVWTSVPVTRGGRWTTANRQTAASWTTARVEDSVSLRENVSATTASKGRTVAL